MADRGEIEALLRGLYAARMKGDPGEIMGYFSAGARYELAGSPATSKVCAQVEGEGGLRAAFTNLTNAFAWLDQTILSMIIDGDKAAVHYRCRLRSNVSGDEVITELADIAHVQDGKFVFFAQFCDTALAARLVLPRAA